jgi:dTDP-4-dehydrorhamnose reductase
MTAKRKLMVTGAHGFVAGSILAQAAGEWELHAVSRGEPLAGGEPQHWHRADPLKAGELAHLFGTVRPDVVIHTAALADINFCQTHPELARAVNVGFTTSLYRLCAQTGAKLVFCSTDTIFDGEHAPYDETATPRPVNCYAETKVAAEAVVARLGANAVIARLALVVGLPFFGAGNAFLPRMLAAFKEGRTVAAFEHEVRTPVDVITAGRALLELAVGDYHGVFHLAGHDRLSRLTMAQRIAERFGYPARLVVPQSPETVSGRASRPRDVSLANAKACAKLKTPMRTFDESLSLVLEAAHNHPP